MTDLATNPQGGEAVSDDQIIEGEFTVQGVDTDAQNPDNANDEGLDGNDQQTEPVEELEEIDYEGAKHKVPKVLKEAFLRQADYTQKTQALAAERSTLAGHEQRFAQHVEVHNATAQDRVQVAILDQQIAAYSPEALRQLAIDFPDQLPLAQLELQQLQQQRAEAFGKLTDKQNWVLDQQRRHAATQAQESLQVLTRDIPGWGVDLATKVQSFGQETYGFTPAEFSQVTDARHVKVLHDAMQWRQHQAQQTQARRIAQGQKTTPAATISGRGTGGKFQADASTDDFAAFERLADDRLKAKR